MVSILHPTAQGSQIPIDRAVVLIGRSPECDVVLDVSSKISRMHCALVQVDADYYIRDLGSMNGVTVAGQRIEKDVKLTNGVEVMIGDVKFLYLENVMPAAKSAKPIAVKGMPVFFDETVEVLEDEEIEVVEPVPRNPPVARIASPPALRQSSALPSGTPDGRNAKRPPEIVDAEIIEDVEVIEDVEILDDVEVVDAIEVIEDVDVIEDVEVIDDVDVIDDQQRRSSQRPGRR